MDSFKMFSEENGESGNGTTLQDSSDFSTTQSLPTTNEEFLTSSTSFEPTTTIHSLTTLFSTLGMNASESYTGLSESSTNSPSETTVIYSFSTSSPPSTSPHPHGTPSLLSTFIPILSPTPSIPLFPVIVDYCVPSEDWTRTEMIFTLIPTTLIMLFIIFGNFLVIASILTQKSLRTPSNIYIFSLALTDILVGIFILPFNVYDQLNNGWELGNILCRTWLTADVTLCSSSILHISAIAVDRFRSINEGLAYAQTRTLQANAIVCGGLWFLALWIASPPVLGWNDWKDQYDTDVCALTRKWGYIVHSATGAFFIPAFVMIGVYIRIYFLLRRKFRERSEMKCMDHQSSHDLDQSSGDTGIATGNSSGELIEEKSTAAAPVENDNEKKSTMTNFFRRTVYKVKNPSFNSSEDGNNVSEAATNEQSTSSISRAREETKSSSIKSSTSRFPSGNKSTLQRFLSRVAVQENRKPSQQISAIMQKKIKFSLNKERKAAKTLGILISAFVICWSPFTFTYLLSGVLPKCYVGSTFFQIVTWLGYVNSAINPVIYNMYSAEFKTAFKKLVVIWGR